MKTNSRGDNAQNEKRDSQGRFESEKGTSGRSHSTKSHESGNQSKSHSTSSRSENAKNEKRDSHGRFE